MPKTINDITTSAASAANVDLFHIWKSAQSQKITAQALMGSGLTVKSAAGTAATTGLQVGAATVGLFSGGSGATEYLGLSANGTEAFRTTATASTFTAVARVPSGSAAAPSLAFSASTTTGLFRPSANEFGVSCSGTAMLRASTAGVRIQSGVSAAASDIFHVANTAGTVDILRCSDSLGTVGIGGAPVSGVGLTVTNTSTQCRLAYDGSNHTAFAVGSTGVLTVTHTGAIGSTSILGAGVNLTSFRAILRVGATTALAASVGGAISLDGIYTGSTQTQFAGLKAYKENATDGETGGHLDCYSRTNGSVAAANLRVCAAGNVLVRSTTTTQTAGASAQLQVDSTTRGFLPPRMTEAERDAIGTPAAGLIVYNTDTNLLNFYNGSAWGAI